jgi:hypothetical protein
MESSDFEFVEHNDIIPDTPEDAFEESNNEKPGIHREPILEQDPIEPAPPSENITSILSEIKGSLNTNNAINTELLNLLRNSQLVQPQPQQPKGNANPCDPLLAPERKALTETDIDELMYGKSGLEPVPLTRQDAQRIEIQRVQAIPAALVNIPGIEFMKIGKDVSLTFDENMYSESCQSTTILPNYHKAVNTLFTTTKELQQYCLESSISFNQVLKNISFREIKYNSEKHILIHFTTVINECVDLIRDTLHELHKSHNTRIIEFIEYIFSKCKQTNIYLTVFRKALVDSILNINNSYKTVICEPSKGIYRPYVIRQFTNLINAKFDFQKNKHSILYNIEVLSEFIIDLKDDNLKNQYRRKLDELRRDLAKLCMQNSKLDVYEPTARIIYDDIDTYSEFTPGQMLVYDENISIIYRMIYDCEHTLKLKQLLKHSGGYSYKLARDLEEHFTKIIYKQCDLKNELAINRNMKEIEDILREDFKNMKTILDSQELDPKYKVYVDLPTEPIEDEDYKMLSGYMPKPIFAIKRHSKDTLYDSVEQSNPKYREEIRNREKEPLNPYNTEEYKLSIKTDKRNTTDDEIIKMMGFLTDTERMTMLKFDPVLTNLTDAEIDAEIDLDLNLNLDYKPKRRCKCVKIDRGFRRCKNCPKDFD